MDSKIRQYKQLKLIKRWQNQIIQNILIIFAPCGSYNWSLTNSCQAPRFPSFMKHFSSTTILLCIGWVSRKVLPPWGHVALGNGGGGESTGEETGIHGENCQDPALRTGVSKIIYTTYIQPVISLAKPSQPLRMVKSIEQNNFTNTAITLEDDTHVHRTREDVNVDI